MLVGCGVLLLVEVVGVVMFDGFVVVLMISVSPALMLVFADGLCVMSVSMLMLYFFAMLYSVSFGCMVWMWMCWVVSDMVMSDDCGVLFFIGISILSPALMLVVRFGFAWCRSFWLMLNLRAMANSPSPALMVYS